MTMVQPALTCRKGVLAVSATASLALHGALLAAALDWFSERPGAIENETEAISMELVATEVLEAIEVSPSPEAMATLRSVQSDPGAAEEVPESAVTAKALDRKTPVEEVAVREADEDGAPDGQSVLEGASEPERVRQGIAAHPDSKRVEKAPDLSALRRERTTDAAPRRKGGASARAASRASASSGRASGSTGSALNYAALVRARVAARKPGGSGRRGTVVVSFGVSRSGGLAYASVARSSGDAGLDHSVLAAVRTAGPFPAPPPGASLRFAMPFYFR